MVNSGSKIEACSANQSHKQRWLWSLSTGTKKQPAHHPEWNQRFLYIQKTLRTNLWSRRVIVQSGPKACVAVVELQRKFYLFVGFGRGGNVKITHWQCSGETYFFRSIQASTSMTVIKKRAAVIDKNMHWSAESANWYIAKFSINFALDKSGQGVLLRVFVRKVGRIDWRDHVDRLMAWPTASSSHSLGSAAGRLKNEHACCVQRFRPNNQQCMQCILSDLRNKRSCVLWAFVFFHRSTCIKSSLFFFREKYSHLPLLIDRKFVAMHFSQLCKPLHLYLGLSLSSFFYVFVYFYFSFFLFPSSFFCCCCFFYFRRARESPGQLWWWWWWYLFKGFPNRD